MNMALPALPTVQEFFTAAELAEAAARLGYKGLPTSESGVIRRAKRDGWADLPKSLCRKRAGKTGGGGLEYHISLVPELQSMLVRERKLRADASMQLELALDAPPPAKPSPAAPSRRCSTTRDARAQIIVSIIGHASRHGLKVSQGLAVFLKAQEAHELWRTACEIRDRGDIPTHQHMRALQDGSPLTSETDFWITEEVLALANNRPRAGVSFQKVSRATLYGWLKAYQQGGAEALAPDVTKVEQPIPDEFWTFMKVYARPAKLKITHAHSAYALANAGSAQLLTLDQVTYTLRHKLNHIERNAGREGTLALRARMAYVSRDTEGLYPTSVYTGDGKTFDAEIADPDSLGPMRPELTSILDVATRYCVGWAISRKENTVAVTEALRNACVDRGIPALFYVDRGAGYKNKRFDDDATGLMARLGITKMHALPYGSQAKGLIERSHQTIWDPLARSLPTYLGENMDREARQKAFKQSRRELKEFGWSKLLMPWDEFRARCQETVDAYNATPHSALPKFVDPETGRIRHMSPAEAWAAQEAAGFEAVTVDPDLIDDLFRPYEERTVNRCIVRIWNNEYFSLALNDWHEQKVLVGYDDAQADRVWVRAIDRETGEPGHLICIAEFGGNRVDYVPRTALRAAEEQRFKGQMKRLDDKRRAKEAQRSTPWIEQEAVEIADFIDMRAPEPEPAQPIALAVDNTAQTAPVSPVLTTDAELAKLCIADPSQLTEGRARVLREAMSRRSGRELLRISGVDLTTLDDLLRSAA